MQNSIRSYIRNREEPFRFKGYIDKEKENALKMKKLEDFRIADEFDFSVLSSLGAEAKEKFRKTRPRTIGQASRISGVNPSDIAILMAHLGK